MLGSAKTSATKIAPKPEATEFMVGSPTTVRAALALDGGVRARVARNCVYSVTISAKRGTRLPFTSTVSLNIAAGRTQSPRSP